MYPGLKDKCLFLLTGRGFAVIMEDVKWI
jgi:hypothetical protein